MIENILAKSLENGGDNLIEHSKKTCDNALRLAKKLTNNERILSLVCLSALFHDLGKANPDFQKILKNEYPGEYEIDHGVLSVFWFNKFVHIKGLEESSLKNGLYRSIVYHHPLRNDIDCDKLSEVDSKDAYEIAKVLVDYYNSLGLGGYTLEIKEDCDDDYFEESWKIYLGDSPVQDSKTLFFSYILRYADILASDNTLSFENMCLRKCQDDFIFNKPSGYDERFNDQLKYAEELFKNPYSCFVAETSFGKTLFGLMWMLMNKKKSYWVCPRNSIAEGTYNTICKELKALGLDDKVSVTLLLTNQYMGGLGPDSDIIVTNIDNLVRPTFKADANIRAYTLLHSNVIFDEFHEYLTKEAILGAYLSLKRIREEYCGGEVKTLCMTATYLKELWFDGVDDRKHEECLYKLPCEKILSRTVQIHFDTNSLNDNIKDTDTLYFGNSVTEVQRVWDDGLVNDLIHAKYSTQDRENKFKKLYSEHGKTSRTNTSWSGTRVVSTGLDISFGRLRLEWITPEILVQIAGRCGRWDELDHMREITISYDKCLRSERCAVDTFFDTKIASTFYEFLRENIEDGEVIEYRKLYELRDLFYKTVGSTLIKDFFRKCKSESFKTLRLLKYEHAHHMVDDDVVFTSDKPSLRSSGENYRIFVRLIDSTKYDSITGETGDFTNDVFEFEIPKDFRKIPDMFLKADTRIIKKYLEKHQDVCGKYFPDKHSKYNKHKFERFFGKDPVKVNLKLIENANCSDTPYLLFKGWRYNSDKGIYKI